jgi:hypothetical protein
LLLIDVAFPFSFPFVLLFIATPSVFSFNILAAICSS